LLITTIVTKDDSTDFISKQALIYKSIQGMRDGYSFPYFFNAAIVAFVNRINMPTMPAYITITKKENPISTGKPISVKI